MTEKKGKMAETTLKAIIDSHINNSMGYIGGELTAQRSKAMEYYLGEKFGNEVEGRSQVISTDVADTVEWILPSLIKTFAASDDAVVFDPVGQEDFEICEQETDYVNHVFYKDNPGFIILYTWIKDALLQKNGIVKTFWEETKKETREEYQGLSEDELLFLSQDKELEPIEHSENKTVVMSPMGPVEQVTHDVVFKRTKVNGRVKIINVAPENYLISKNHPHLDVKDAPFVAHKEDFTASELREMGVPQDIINKLPNAQDRSTEEEVSRDYLDEESSDYSTQALVDKSSRKITVYECYVLVDFNNDGISELRKVTKSGDEILFNEEVDSIPFDILTPVILPHKHFGLSIADLVMDLQLIKSTIWRQMLDNMYLINNSRTAVNKNSVNLDDLLTSRPGGVVRCDGDPGMSLAPIVTQPLSPTSYQMIEYIDRVREGRTGVSQATTGLNDDLLSNNKGDQTVARVMTAAEQRIELVARIFAETGIKSLFIRIHELLQKHQDKERVVKLRNKWVPVKPTEWIERTDMTVNVGLGNGERQQQVQALMLIMNMQKEIIANGGLNVLVTLMNIYQTGRDLSKFLGIKNPEAYLTDPKSEASQKAIEDMKQKAELAKQMDPNLLYVKVEAEKNQITAQKNTLEHQRAMIELEGQRQKLMAEYQQKMADVDNKNKEQIDALAVKLTELELKYMTDVPGSVV